MNKEEVEEGVEKEKGEQKKVQGKQKREWERKITLRGKTRRRKEKEAKPGTLKIRSVQGANLVWNLTKTMTYTLKAKVSTAFECNVYLLNTTYFILKNKIEDTLSK